MHGVGGEGRKGEGKKRVALIVLPLPFYGNLRYEATFFYQGSKHVLNSV